MPSVPVSFLIFSANSRDCRHITAARGLLPQLEVEGIVERNRSQRTTDLTQPVSHLPIPVPIWAHIPDDKLPPIDIPGQLPSVFLFDETVRCSCGNTKPSAFRESHKFIIFGLSAAQVHQIETSPCSECRETRTNTRASLGPDLGRYGVFNWNNRIGFSHQLLNRYCIQFRRQETPFDAFYETTVDTYLESGSPENLCGQKTFVSAWFAFVRLQEIGSSMRCSICGPDPEIVIVDGVSIGFASQRIRGLKPPTKRLVGRVRVTPGSFRGTCFVGTRSAQTTILKALDVSDPDTRCAELRSHLEKLQTVRFSLEIWTDLRTMNRMLRYLKIASKNTVLWRKTEATNIVPVTVSSFCKFSAATSSSKSSDRQLLIFSRNILEENLSRIHALLLSAPPLGCFS